MIFNLQSKCQDVGSALLGRVYRNYCALLKYIPTTVFCHLIIYIYSACRFVVGSAGESFPQFVTSCGYLLKANANYTPIKTLGHLNWLN